MPINKITSSKRGRAAVLAGIMAAAATGWTTYKASVPAVTPAAIHRAVDKGIRPPAVEIALELIKPWEGLRTRAYLDSIGVPTICIGETMVGGKPVRLGMTMTEEQCKAMFITRVTRDFYLPLVDKLDGFVDAPDSVQAAAISIAYNAGTGVLTRPTSTAGRFITARKYPEACAALTAFNRAGGKVLPGLVARREMGDKSRVGEAEVCLSTDVK